MGVSGWLLPFARGLLTVMKWIGAVVAVVVLIVAGLFAYGRLRGPDAAGRAALAAMQPTRAPPAGRNAFPVLWLAGWPVPDDQLQAVTAADLRHLYALVTQPVPKNLAAATVRANGIDNYVSVAQARWPAPPLPNLESLCGWSVPDCLAFVTGHRAAVEAALAQAALPLHRARQLAQTGFLWNELPPDPRYGGMGNAWGPPQWVWLTALADRFVRGERVAALTDTCTAIATWRRLHQGTNDLSYAMGTAAFVSDDIRLAAAMLAQLPPDTPTPAACAQALRPVTAADVDSCAWAQRQQATSMANLDWMIGNAQTGKAHPWFWFDRRQASAWLAEQNAPLCRPALDARLLADDPAAATLPALFRFDLAGCVSSLIPCVLDALGRSSLRALYSDEIQRTADYAAHLRLGAALLALRAAPTVAGQTLAQRYAALPADLHSPGHVSGVSADGRSLYVVDHWRPSRPDARFVLPLPVAAAAAH
ncbi:MAG: hypothetical protein KGJ50_03200 [Xanthomonadaceae bacterium]|nr:hypothetical protein [Xanthomonadaceae bacterium]MDE2244918.1 hypothetical protein [Xanthomonadaceae bacterium]